MSIRNPAPDPHHELRILIDSMKSPDSWDKEYNELPILDTYAESYQQLALGINSNISKVRPGEYGYEFDLKGQSASFIYQYDETAKRTFNMLFGHAIASGDYAPLLGTIACYKESDMAKELYHQINQGKLGSSSGIVVGGSRASMDRRQARHNARVDKIQATAGSFAVATVRNDSCLPSMFITPKLAMKRVFYGPLQSVMAEPPVLQQLVKRELR
jgi:hypothetical protein